jgi:hypothetical protein
VLGAAESVVRAVLADPAAHLAAAASRSAPGEMLSS